MEAAIPSELQFSFFDRGDLGVKQATEARTERVQQLAGMMAEKEGITAADFAARWEREIPMKRLGEPREFAALAAFLVSERASYITGTSIQVDGGWIRSLF